jgi:hypothetical protein
VPGCAFQVANLPPQSGGVSAFDPAHRNGHRKAQNRRRLRRRQILEK